MGYNTETVRIFIIRTAIFLNIKIQISALIINNYLEVKKTKGLSIFTVPVIYENRLYVAGAFVLS